MKQSLNDWDMVSGLDGLPQVAEWSHAAERERPEAPARAIYGSSPPQQCTTISPSRRPGGLHDMIKAFF